MSVGECCIVCLPSTCIYILMKLNLMPSVWYIICPGVRVACIQEYLR